MASNLAWNLQQSLRLGLTVATEIWSYPIGDWVSSVHAADIDGDGDVEILLASRNSNIYILAKDRTLEGKYRSSGGWIRTIRGGDNAGDSDKTHIVVGSRDNRVQALDKNGDGKSEILVASEDHCLHVLSSETGEVLWKYATGGVVHAVDADDIDLDGEIEILVTSGDAHLYSLDSQGRVKWKSARNAEVFSILAADIDGDGQIEILLASNAEGIYALTAQLQEKWHFPLDKRVLSLTIADLDRDGQLEIIAAAEDTHLYFLDQKGQLLWSHSLNSQVFSVYAIDLDNDGLVEILVGTEDSIRVLRIELIRNLRESILATHMMLGRPLAPKLPLSANEITLLQEITNEGALDKQFLTLASVKQYSQSGNYLEMLSTLMLLAQQRVQILWSREIGHIRAIYAGDLNNDGRLEIVAGTNEGGLYVFDARGEKLWSRMYDDRILTVYIGDIDLDGVLEIAVGSAHGWLRIFGKDGEEKWQSRFDHPIESVYINEVKSLGYAEMVVGLSGNQGRIQIYDHHFSPVIEPIITSHSIKVVGLHDLDDDGLADIIAAGEDDRVYAYKRDGVLLWSYKVGDRVGDLAQGLSLRDIDADGQVEIVIGSEDRNVHILDKAGHFKWCYYTPHRVLSVNTQDVDQDGAVEVFLGTDDGYVYFLSRTGDLLWKYKVGGRVRGIQADDLNRDGDIEIAVGSEDQVLYVLQILNQEEMSRAMEEGWQALRSRFGNQEELLYEMAGSSSAALRCFALIKVAGRPVYQQEDLEILQSLVSDPSSEVRSTFAREITKLHQASPDHTRLFLDILLADQERDVRLALTESVAALTRIDSSLGFQYLERLTRSVDGWIRRAVARKLYQLADTFPQRVFRLLLGLIADETEWVCQEAARALAHYFDLHQETLIEESGILVAHDIDFALLQLIAHCSTRPDVQGVFSVTYDLLVDLDETNVLQKLEKALKVFRKVRKLNYGEETWQVYRELYRLHRMRSIDEISGYSCDICQQDLSRTAQFDGIILILQQLTGISVVLASYLKREGLGDRLASLLEASSAIESIRLGLERASLGEKGQQAKFPAHLLLEILLTRWRDIVVVELRRLRGKANLKPELRTKTARFEAQVGIWLDIHNEGRSPADNLKVRLRESADFGIVGKPLCELETVPVSGTAAIEFTIIPRVQSLRLAFEIIYDDAESKEKTFLFADQLEMRENNRVFKPVINPYSIGVPIQTREMFYGREQDLEGLREDLTSPSANMVVVLYGQRRTGKSSLLYQLLNSESLSSHILVYIDMQRETLGLTTSRFLYRLAFAIHARLKAKGIIIALPSAQDFTYDPTFAFDQFLDEAEEARGQCKLIIMIDEFEILEQKVNEKALDWEIFEYLRSLMQHRRGMNFLLSGTHTIEQLTRSYWSVFFNIARHHKLSRLQQEASRQLITEPVKGSIEYDPLAIEKIRQLAADQPYFIQLFCRSLVSHCNRNRKSYITINDVNTVQDEVMETGQIHFKWLWGQTTLEGHLVLSIVAQEGGEEGQSLSLNEIKEVYQANGLLYHHETVLQTLEKLIEADIIERVAEGMRFRIPIGLVRKWLLADKPLRRVLLEENLSSH